MPTDPKEAAVIALDQALQDRLSMALDFTLLTEIIDRVIAAYERAKLLPTGSAPP